jgi:predicted MPP superfamily phosphohydrolase
MLDFPRGFPIPALLLFVSLPLQVYLFGQVRRYLNERIANANLLTKLTFLLACCFVLMHLPLTWRVFFGTHAFQPSSVISQGFFTASSIWVVGSIGSALILFGYNLFQRFILLSRRPEGPEPDPGRRQFLTKGAGMVAAVPFMVSGYGALLERRRFEVDHLDIPCGALSSELAHLTLVQLTDLHVGPFMSPEELAAYVEAANRLKPDLIALTGDFVTSSEGEVEPCVATLAGLKARYGVFACIGNHDIYAQAADKLVSLFKEKGIQTLRNEAVTLQVAGSKLSMLGIDDLRTGRPDLPRALQWAETKPGELKILLSHRPEIFPQAAKGGVDLVLSGHYHGGQVKLGQSPESLSIARLLTPFAEGLFQLPRQESRAGKSAHLFVSRGVGITGLPIRINCPPQIAHLTLRKA